MLMSSARLVSCALVTIASLQAGCGSTGFSGSNNTRPIAAEGADGGSTAPVTENFTSETLTGKATVDVVFAIDTSGSMTEETAALNQNLSAFLRSFINNNVDARVTVIGQSMLEGIGFPGGAGPGGITVPTIEIPADLPKDRIVQHKAMVDSFNAIGILNQFFALPTKPLPLRTDGILEVVVISDDDGKGNGNLAADFVKPQARSVRFNGIVGISETSTSGCDIANIGSQYQSLASQTQGMIFDLCSPDWSKLLNELSAAIVSRAGQGFQVSRDVDVSKPVTVNMNGQVLAPTEFEVVGRSIVVKKELPVGAKVTISYYPKS